MAQDPPEPQKVSDKEAGSSPPAGLGRPAVKAGTPVPFEQSFATPSPYKPLSRDELSDDDLRDIQDLLSQEQDVTRQDIQRQDFQGMIDRYTHAKKGD